MTDLYLIRHAQAGTRGNYDVLSDLGRRQARLLGEYLAQQPVDFEAVYSGSMRRQLETAEIVCDSLSTAGRTAAPIQIEERCNEFSLLSVYRAIVTRMIEDSPEFARDFEEMQQMLDCDPHTTRGAAGRCDLAVIRAWMENRYADYDGEAWAAFRERILAMIRDVTDQQSDRTVAMFTSATPIAVLASEALGLTTDKLMGILGVITNSSLTIVRASSELRLFTFNSTPHLNSETRTYR